MREYIVICKIFSIHVQKKRNISKYIFHGSNNKNNKNKEKSLNGEGERIKVSKFRILCVLS